MNLMGVTRPPDQLAPTLGQHNEYVLRDLLGLDDAEYMGLKGANVIGQVPANRSMTPPADPAELLRMGFLAEHDLNYRMRLGLDPEE